MANNELKTILTLDNKTFQNNLSKSTQQIQNFKSQGETNARQMQNAFNLLSKSGAGVSVAIAVKEGFEEFMN